MGVAQYPLVYPPLVTNLRFPISKLSRILFFVFRLMHSHHIFSGSDGNTIYKLDTIPMNSSNKTVIKKITYHTNVLGCFEVIA